MNLEEKIKKIATHLMIDADENIMIKEKDGAESVFVSINGYRMAVIASYSVLPNISLLPAYAGGKVGVDYVDLGANVACKMKGVFGKMWNKDISISTFVAADDHIHGGEHWKVAPFNKLKNMCEKELYEKMYPEIFDVLHDIRDVIEENSSEENREDNVEYLAGLSKKYHKFLWTGSTTRLTDRTNLEISSKVKEIKKIIAKEK